MPPAPARPDLAAFAGALATRLPGTWTTAYSRHAAYADQLPTTTAVWDAGAVGYAASNYVLHHQAVLALGDGARLLVMTWPPSTWPGSALASRCDPPRPPLP